MGVRRKLAILIEFTLTGACVLGLCGCAAFETLFNPLSTTEQLAQASTEVENVGGSLTAVLPPPLNWIVLAATAGVLAVAAVVRQRKV